MGLRYDKRNSVEESGAMWTSYSDLFMALSVIFLLLYVVASLKQGASSVQKTMEYQQLAKQAEDLRQQIKVYDSLKQDYIENGASEDEQTLYNELMEKLDLLQDQAKNEKNELRKKALENEQKERALNKYQQAIRNVINTNLVAQARIKRRDTIIEKKEDIIVQKGHEIKGLETQVAEKQEIIKQGERTISQINEQLDKKIKELRWSYKAQKITKKKLDAETARLKLESERRVSTLREQNQQIENQLKSVQGELSTVATKLDKTQEHLQKTEGEKQRLAGELQSAAGKYQQQVEGLKGEFEAQRLKDRAAFDRELNAQKLSAAARAAKEAEFKAASDRKSRELADKIAGLNAKVKDTEGELAKAKALANASKALAHQIRARFAKGGIKADVDENTGDVLLSFGEQYFDTGKADLKPGMRNIIERAVPLYSQSLFEDPKIAEKIASVEIVGFASPTFKNKYVDPTSLKPEDRTAVDYNLDLSFARARSIFTHIFDTDKMTFKHQRQLLPLVKVTGRSFLAETKNERGVASGSATKDFCDAHDCQKAQRVIIKFTLKD